MTDKVQKIKEWISKEQDGLMDANGNFDYPEHEGAYNILCNLDYYIDSLQEEPVSIWHDASKEPNDMSHCLIFYGDKNAVGHYLHYEPVLYNHREKVFVTESFPHPTGYKVEQKSIDGGCVTEVYKNKRDRISISDITQWCYLKDLHNLSNVERTVKNWKEPVSEDLGDYINELSKQFPEVSFAKLSRIAVRVSRWQRNQDAKNKLPEVIDRTDLDEYAYQCAYDMSNDWAIDNPTWHDVEDACKLGAKWQKKQDQSTIELAEDHAMLAGMEKMKEEMMANATDVTVHIDAGGYPYIPQMELYDYDYDNDVPLAKEGDKYKVVLIKEE